MLQYQAANEQCVPRKIIITITSERKMQTFKFKPHKFQNYTFAKSKVFVTKTAP